MKTIDLLIRIKNGYMAEKESIEAQYSKYSEEILKKLKTLGYVQDYVVEGETKKKISIQLFYDEAGAPAMTDVKIFSTPGRRWYIGHDEAKPVLGGIGNAIISSSEGIITDREAREMSIGGELLFHIW